MSPKPWPSRYEREFCRQPRHSRALARKKVLGGEIKRPPQH